VKSLIKKITSWLKKEAQSNAFASSPSALALANWNDLNRRRSTRIKYAHIGPVGDLPNVTYDGTDYYVGNISVGGLLLLDPLDTIPSETGTIIKLKLSWPQEEKYIRARIVAAQLQRRHLQFIDFDPELHKRLNTLIAPGHLGSQFRLVENVNNIMVTSEFWLGPNNESIVFDKEYGGHVFAKIIIEHKIYAIPIKEMPYHESADRFASLNEISKLLVLLANIPKPSERIKALIEHLNEKYLDLKNRSLNVVA
jgi:hypothetical protein